MWPKKLEPKTALSTWKKILVQLFISEFVSSIVITSNCVQCSQQANCSIQYWASRLFKTLQMILYYNPPCMLKLIKKLNQVFRVICFNKHNRVLSWVRYKFSLSFFLWETWHLQSDIYDLINLVLITDLNMSGHVDIRLLHMRYRSRKVHLSWSLIINIQKCNLPHLVKVAVLS